ncbi:MAG: hypothetical protein HYW69_00785, partial [Candidatus Nealsonbacteria bacterium]|nr:hypothetical protein [Candidatus Nealsonbacteria bacterium]
MVNLSTKLIRRLYYEEELSTLEIAAKLDITPWIVLKFMKKMNLPRRSFKQANTKRFEKKPITFLLKKNLSAREKELKIAGIMLYWEEGNKANHENGIDFANSEPRMIKLFLRFLRDICEVDEKRLRVYLYCYADQNIDEVKRYWRQITNIHFPQFTKPYIRKDFLAKKSGKMKHGLAHIRYSDKKLFLQIVNWVE